MAVEAHLLAVFLSYLHVSLRHNADLLRIEGAKAVGQIDHVHIGTAEKLQTGIQIHVIYLGDSHHIDRDLVALFLCVLDHLDGDGQLMDVGGHADHIDGTFGAGQNILLIVGAARIGHHAEL